MRSKRHGKKSATLFREHQLRFSERYFIDDCSLFCLTAVSGFVNIAFFVKFMLQTSKTTNHVCAKICQVRPQKADKIVRAEKIRQQKVIRCGRTPFIFSLMICLSSDNFASTVWARLKKICIAENLPIFYSSVLFAYKYK